MYSFSMEHPDPSPAQQKKSSAILDAAARHFAAHGFEDTKLSAVAHDAGVAVGTIYLRYDGKAELLGGVLAKVEGTLCDAMDTPEIWGTPFPDRFGRIAAALLAKAGQTQHLSALMALTPFAPSTPQGHAHAMLTLIEAHVADGVERHELRADLETRLVARMAHGMVDGAMKTMMADPKTDPQTVVAHIADAYQRWLAL